MDAKEKKECDELIQPEFLDELIVVLCKAEDIIKRNPSDENDKATIELQKKRHVIERSKRNMIKETPNVIIYLIASFLGCLDYLNFGLSCNYIRGILLSDRNNIGFFNLSNSLWENYKKSHGAEFFFPEEDLSELVDIFLDPFPMVSFSYFDLLIILTIGCNKGDDSISGNTGYNDNNNGWGFRLENNFALFGFFNDSFCIFGICYSNFQCRAYGSFRNGQICGNGKMITKGSRECVLREGMFINHCLIFGTITTDTFSVHAKFRKNKRAIAYGDCIFKFLDCEPFSIRIPENPTMDEVSAINNQLFKFRKDVLLGKEECSAQFRYYFPQYLYIMNDQRICHYCFLHHGGGLFSSAVDPEFMFVNDCACICSSEYEHPKQDVKFKKIKYY